MTVVRKASGALSAGRDFVLSDATVDRYGDVVDPAGWDVKSFRLNPIALFNHNNDAPIGRWENIRIASGALRAELVPAEEGTSARIDEIRRLIDQGILKAASVGFLPRKSEPLAGGRGTKFLTQELLECSLVSVPANPSALQQAKSMNISDDTLALVFGKQAIEFETRELGKQARSKPPQNGLSPMKISERITDAQERLIAAQEALQAHVDGAGENADEASQLAFDELTANVDTIKRSLENLQKAERSLANTAQTIVVERSQITTSEEQANERRPFAVAAKKVAPSDYVFRSLVVAVKSHGSHRPFIDVMKETYGEDVATKAVMDVVLRAASVPADTVTPAWAGALVNTAIADFFDLLMPQSVYPGLSEKGSKFSFGRNGIVSIPSRAATPTIAGSFVGQGAPIPVRQGAFSAITLTPKKMAVITTMTREIMEHSTPAIEGILRQAIQEDTSVALDSILLDATAASVIRPAGLRSGVTVTTATAGGGFAALVGDIKALAGALIASTNGNIRNPVWIMNPVQVLSIALTQNAGGDFPFKAEVNGGTLQGYPLISSATVPAGFVFLIDAADFVSATGDEPRFDVSDQATLHMEDTTPLALSATGTPNVVAAPIRSLFQTDSFALRMIMDVNWAVRRTGVVAWTQTVTW